MTRYDYSIEINWAGMNEEFHQKRREYFMYDYWRNRRVTLIKELQIKFP